MTREEFEKSTDEAARKMARESIREQWSIESAVVTLITALIMTIGAAALIKKICDAFNFFFGGK